MRLVRELKSVMFLIPSREHRMKKLLNCCRRMVLLAELWMLSESERQPGFLNKLFSGLFFFVFVSF